MAVEWSLDVLGPIACPGCGVEDRSFDEDGCCVSCGADVFYDEDGSALANLARQAAHELHEQAATLQAENAELRQRKDAQITHLQGVILDMLAECDEIERLYPVSSRVFIKRIRAAGQPKAAALQPKGVTVEALGQICADDEREDGAPIVGRPASAREGVDDVE